MNGDIVARGATAAESPRARANREQLAASDPAVSAFVAASAGSGKTKLLTDRLLRLMLAGAKPERIQCLTFTKAAAAEMAVRLQRILGKWVTLPADALADELRRLRIEPTDDALADARKLFARVLDLPGGMRIGTIHAFCQSLLRRFPLEAALSPHFQLVDERDAADALTEAREDMLARADTAALRDALTALAGLASAEQFGRQVDALEANRDRLDAVLALPDLAAAQRRALGITATTEAEVIATAVNWQGERDLREAARIVQQLGAKLCAERAGRMLDWLDLAAEDRAEHWDHWCSEFLTQKGEARADSAFASKAVTTRHPDLVRLFQTEASRILAALDECRALRVAELSAALLTLAAPVVRAYAERKDDAGLLDYEDLIGRTSALLRDPGVAWVLYKLDGGLDHLLLDEVQDTAPAQWHIAHALTEEFFAGSGARDDPRTVFAVGDRKQSIYSFQGADADAFISARNLLARRVTQADKPWRDVQLDVSFRSTAPVLALVDAVFRDPAAAAGVVAPGEALEHYADRAEHAGAVELWPLAPLPDSEDPPPWSVAEHNQGLQTAPQLLAETLAGWIREQTSGTVMLASRDRKLAPGDVMVLVRRRNDFARALVRALKARGVPVAGLDRLVLTEQPAVQDLMALADALLLPEDDLTFACLLTSPLGGLSDDDLMALAVHRRAPLWETLRARAGERPHWQRAWDFFAALLARVDYVSPYLLFAEALGPLGGRARLYARLGPEAAEPVDELLNAALAYARTHPPSVQGFLHWLRRSGAEVKREAEAAGGLVRVMTVHGAKGLQAPLVILPDTTAIPPDEGTILWADDPRSGVAVPLWTPRRELRCVAAERIRGDLARRRMEEHNRLLYVALTRAEDRLVVCGWQTRRPLPDTCWYNLVSQGFSRVGAVAGEGGLLPATPDAAMPAAATPAAATPVSAAPAAVTPATAMPAAATPVPAAPAAVTPATAMPAAATPVPAAPAAVTSATAMPAAATPVPATSAAAASASPVAATIAGWGERLHHSSPQRVGGGGGRATAPEQPPQPPPAWLVAGPDGGAAAPPREPARPLPLAPSRPEGVELGQMPPAASPLAERAGQVDRFRRGQLLHALLQHLPALPAEDRPAAARSWLDRPGHGLAEDAVATLAEEALAILAHPELAPLFAPGSRAEVPLTGLVGDAVVGGLVDRLAVLPDRVLLADFKTNRRPPAQVADTPVMYLRQMAAYRAVLRGIFPDRPVRCALVWTRSAQVAMLPDDLLNSHLPSHAADAA